MSQLHVLDPNPHGNPAILFLHGLGAKGDSWILQLPYFSSLGFRTIAPDIPGFGESGYDGQGWKPSWVARRMAELLRERNTGAAHIVGLSMGGVIAQEFARNSRQLTRSLVLASTFTVLRPDNLSAWIYFLVRAFSVMTVGPSAQAQLVAERVFPGNDKAVLRELLVKSISQADRRAYRAAIRSLATFDSRTWLKDLHIPTLVVTGEQDTTVSLVKQETLYKSIADARRVVIQDAGHAVNIDQANQFNQVLTVFFTDLSGDCNHK